jgi:hypothetical protein
MPRAVDPRGQGRALPAMLSSRHSGCMQSRPFAFVPSRRASCLAGLVLALAAAPALADLSVDGRLDEPEWQAAQRFDDFRVTEPFSGVRSEFPTQLNVLARPEGLYLALRMDVPPAQRVHGQSPRDAQPLAADPAVFMVDFEGRGRTAYEFTVTISKTIRDGVVLNQSQVTYDWDAVWFHGVQETEQGWTAEVMIPWWVAPGGDGTGEQRTIGLYAGTYLKSQSRRVSYPAVEILNPTFVADFQKVKVPRYAGSTLDFYPYVSIDLDRLAETAQGRAGIDLFWKPNSSQQLTATLNPDFGQVESDDLIVNFSATETFFSDKRPFFTEGQQLFDVRFTNDGRLVNTRRIGAAPDAGPEDVTDVLTAAKYTGQTGGLEYGLFGAVEDDAVEAEGRDFLVTRLKQSAGAFSVGWLGTWTRRPTLAREAMVNMLEVNWYPQAAVSLQTRFMQTDRTQDASSANAEVAFDERGRGAVAAFKYQPGGLWSQEVELTWLDQQFNVNDLGYQERADLREIGSVTTLYRRSYPDGHWLSGSQWGVEGAARWNQDGTWLPGNLEFGRFLNLSNGDFLNGGMWYDTPGTDDRLTRGNGDVRLDSGGGAWLEWQGAESGKVRMRMAADAWRENLGGYGWGLEATPKFVLTEGLTVAVELRAEHTDGWVIWTEGSELGVYERDQLQVAIDGNWFPAPRHELRLKFQWIGLEAACRAAYTVADDPDPVLLPEPAEDFSLSQLGLQIRYRYELAPLSDLYVVYARGGELFALGQTLDMQDLWTDSLDNPTADRFFIKLRYRF